MINACRSHLRRRLVERRHALTREESGHAANPHNDEVWMALDTLSARQRIAIVLRFYLKVSDEQIAEHLGC